MGRLFAAMLAVMALFVAVPATAGAFQFLGKWGTTVPGHLSQPFDLVVNPDTGDQYVADHGNNRIVEFGPTGGFVRSWGGLGSGDTKFNEPGGVGLDAQGNVWVADFGNDRVKKFSPAGALLDVFGVTGTNPGELSEPTDVAVDASGNFYEVEQSEGRVQKFAPNGDWVKSWSSPDLTGVAVAGSTVYVANYNGDTVSRFDTQGNPLGTVGGSGSGALKFSQPWHLGVGPGGSVYVADRSNARVQKLSATLGFVNAFGWGVATGAPQFQICTATCLQGVFGAGDGQFGSPGGVGVDCRGSVYVVDQSYDRVQKFGEPDTPAPPCTTQPPGSGKPSNDFSFGKVKKNRRRGTATLKIDIPGPGALTLVGKGLKAQSVPLGAAADGRAAATADTVRLLVKTKRGKKRRKLNRSGKVRVTPRVTFTPSNGDPNTKAIRIKLIKRH